MIEIGRRKRNQPAPPHAVFEAMTHLDRDPDRPGWICSTTRFARKLCTSIRRRLVVWSSLWVKRPDARIRFDLPPDANALGTDLCWTLLVDEPAPADALVGHMRKRLNQVINANVRYTFGQQADRRPVRPCR